MIDITQIPEIGTWVIASRIEGQEQEILFKIERRSQVIDQDVVISQLLWDSRSGGASFAVKNCVAVSDSDRQNLAEKGGCISVSGHLTRFEPMERKGDRVRVRVGGCKTVELLTAEESVINAARELAIVFGGELISLED